MYRHLVMFPKSADSSLVDEVVDVVNSDDFREVAAAAEALGPTIFVFEVGSV